MEKIVKVLLVQKWDVVICLMLDIVILKYVLIAVNKINMFIVICSLM